MKIHLSSDKKFQSLIKDFQKEVSMDKIYTAVDSSSKAVFDDIVNSTPVDSGLTKSSWKRRLTAKRNTIEVIFENTRVSKNGTPIVVYIKNGHYTRTGGYVRPNDFITPRTDGLTSKISENLTKKG